MRRLSAAYGPLLAIMDAGVAVHEARGVRGVQCLGELLDHRHRTLGRERPGGAEELGDIAPLDEPHVEVEPTVDRPEIVDRHDVRVGRARRERALPAEADDEVLVGREPVEQPFQRDDAAASVSTARYTSPIPPPADELDQPVRPERRRLHGVIVPDVAPRRPTPDAATDAVVKLSWRRRRLWQHAPGGST